MYVQQYLTPTKADSGSSPQDVSAVRDLAETMSNFGLQFEFWIFDSHNWWFSGIIFEHNDFIQKITIMSEM